MIALNAILFQRCLSFVALLQTCANRPAFSESRINQAVEKISREKLCEMFQQGDADG